MMPFDLAGIASLVNLHLQWYPQMEVQDVYKLLYQGVMGSEHLISSKEEFLAYLEDEYASIHPDRSLRLFEPVRPDALLLRINLQAYKSRSLKIQQLVPLLYQTAQISGGSIDELQRTWKAFEELNQRGEVKGFEMDDLTSFSRHLKELNYPAVHHSEIYRKAYQPAYRLIAARFTSELGMTDES